MKLFVSIAFICLTECGFNKWSATCYVVPQNACTKLFQTPFDPPLVPCPFFQLNSWKAGLLCGQGPVSLSSSQSSAPSTKSPVFGFSPWFWVMLENEWAQWLKSGCMVVSKCVSHFLKVLSNSIGVESGHYLKLSAHGHLHLLLLLLVI